jgi:guanine deaminase
MSLLTPFILRGTIGHLTGNPFAAEQEDDVLETFEDGGLLVDPSGQITQIGTFAAVQAASPEAQIVDRSGCIILPGLIDCHIHYPQALIVGAFGEELLDWLNKYIFPEESKYVDPEYARVAAGLFYNEMISQGTTAALIFSAHFEQATHIGFEEAEKRGFRACLGMSVSDRFIPDQFVMSPKQAYESSMRLIETWHGRGKLRYVVTPRFAPTCTDEMLSICGQLLKENPTVYLQTHLNENHKEIEWVQELFPDSASYVDVYERFGLLGERSIFAHSVHSTDEEIARLAATNSRVVHCPASNAFLGSGLMPLKKYVKAGVTVGLGTDVGAGTGYSLLQEMNQAYKVQMLKMVALKEPERAVKLSGIKLFYMATLAGATALSIDSEVGNLCRGKQADFIVIDPTRDPLFIARLKNTESFSEKLFLLATIGGKRMIREVYIDGRLAHGNTAATQGVALHN